MKIKNINFYIYGNGEQKDYILSKCNSNVFYCGNVNKEDLIKVQKSAYALIALLNNDELSKKTFPSKIFEYLATGNEIIISNLTFLDNNLKKYCHVVDKIDEDNLKKVLNNVFIKRIKKNNEKEIYNYLLKNYTWESHSKIIKKLLDGVLYEKNI